MPTDRSQFQIEIKTRADLAGLEATIAKLKGQIEATEKLGKSTADLEAQLHKAQQTQIEAALAGMTGKMKETGEGAKKASEGIEEMIGGHHGIHAIGHALNQALPGLMQFTRFLTSGFTASIGAALLVFEYLKTKIEEFDKMLDELNSGPGARGAWAEKLSENVREAGVEEAVFNERLRETAERQDTLAQSTDKLIEAQKRRTSDAKTVADAEKELALARLALAEKLHQITPEQAVKIRLEIDDEAFRRELEEKVAAIQAELQARMAEQRTNEHSEPGLAAAKDTKEAASLAAKNASDKNAAKLEQDKKNLEEIKEKIAAAEKAVEDFGDDNGITNKGVHELPAYKVAASQRDQLYALRASYERSSKQEEEKLTPLATVASVAKEQAEKAKADYEEAAKLAKEVSATIAKLKTDLSVEVHKNEALQNIHDQTSDIHRREADADAQERIRTGRATPAEQAAWGRQQTQHQAATETGPQASLDASAAIASGRNVVSSLFGQRRANNLQMDEIHSLFDQITGFLESRDTHVQSQSSGLEDVRNRLSQLETRLNQSGGGTGY
jgi:hypothetical protein